MYVRICKPAPFYLLRLSPAEVDAAIADPKRLQASLILLRERHPFDAPIAPVIAPVETPVVKVAIVKPKLKKKASRKVKAVKVVKHVRGAGRAPKQPPEPDADGLIPCPDCNTPVKPKGLGRHQFFCEPAKLRKAAERRATDALDRMSAGQPQGDD